MFESYIKKNISGAKKMQYLLTFSLLRCYVWYRSWCFFIIIKQNSAVKTNLDKHFVNFVNEYNHWKQHCMSVCDYLRSGILMICFFRLWYWYKSISKCFHLHLIILVNTILLNSSRHIEQSIKSENPITVHKSNGIWFNFICV